jgi:CRISPR-associated protein Cmr4
MKVSMYEINFLTNAHIGSGGVNYDIIDNQVQKDVVDNLPVIYSSSLKGAFREHFEKAGEQFVDFIFGSSANENESKQGNIVFFEAFMIYRPLRSNKKPFYQVTAPFIIKKLIAYIEQLDIKYKENEKLKDFYEKIKNISQAVGIKDKNFFVEDIEVKNSLDIDLPKIFNNNLVVLPDEEFKKLSLPVIARNHLENGKSQNLWYEEIVPKFSKFIFFISKPDEELDITDKENLKSFLNRLDREDVYQFGANKTIGMGFAKVKRISDE